MQISLVPPEGAYLTGLIHGREFEYPELAALDRIAAGHPHLNGDGGIYAVFQLVDVDKIGAVLVTHRQPVEQILDDHLRSLGRSDCRRETLSELLRGLHRHPRDLVKMQFV